VELCVPILARYVAAQPDRGHRHLHAQMLADGHVTSQATVLRALRIIREHGGCPALPSVDPATEGRRVAELRTARTADDARRGIGS